MPAIRQQPLAPAAQSGGGVYQYFERAVLALDPDGQRSAVLKFLIVSFAPFVVLAPRGLAEALLDVEGPVEWTHFGDGPERERIEAVVRDLPPLAELVSLNGMTL